MLTLISPAKSLDLDSPVPVRRHTTPALLPRAVELAEVMAGMDAEQLRDLMGISEDLAQLNVQRWREFSPEHTAQTSRPAALTFDGGVYRGMDPRRRFDTRDWTEAQKSLRILSGLYGLLRPLDLIQPYRLEMGTKLVTDRGRDLVSWWGRAITEALADDLAATPGPRVVVNLASAEYWAAVDASRLGARVISPRFENRDRSGRWRVISFPAKTARGRMAGWIVNNRVRSASGLTAFDEGYRHVPEASTPDQPVFRAQ